MRRELTALAAVLLLAACSGSGGGAVDRGDRAFASGILEEALAEYRLAVLQGSEEPEVYGRLGHTYALLSRIDEAADAYARAAAADSTWADQAVADLVRLARQSAERNDLYGVASAIERAREFRPGLNVSELALPLGRHYARSGQPGRAIPFFQQAMAAAPADSAPEILYETGVAHEEVGDCGRAVVFYERYRDIIPRNQRAEVDWRLGSCSFQYGRQLLEEGQLERALRHMETTIEIGEPRSVVGQAWFERGQILSLMGTCTEALESYRQAARAGVAATGALVNLAEARIDEIRFGGFDESFDLEARCGLPEPEFARRPAGLNPPAAADSAGAGADSLDAEGNPVPFDTVPEYFRFLPGDSAAEPDDTTRGVRGSRTIEL